MYFVCGMDVNLQGPESRLFVGCITPPATKYVRVLISGNEYVTSHGKMDNADSIKLSAFEWVIILDKSYGPNVITSVHTKGHRRVRVQREGNVSSEAEVGESESFKRVTLLALKIADRALVRGMLVASKLKKQGII